MFLNNELSILTIILLRIASFYGLEIEKYELVIPNVNPNLPELWLCSSMRINFDKDYYIVGFEPKASMDRIHHMALFGCTEPGSYNSVWSCAEDKSDFFNSELESTSICGTEAIFMYAWARNAPTLKLPPDVGFKVGGNTTMKYLVLQTHYTTFKQSNVVDTTNGSGLVLHVTQQPTRKLAGVVLLGSAGEIQPHSTAHAESSCMIRENKKLHPFAFRTHTHRLGTVATGYQVKTDSNGKHHWTIIGRKNPLKPQMFYPVLNNITLTEGDIVAARCSYYSPRNTITPFGARNDDEMCNFYIMYYVEEGEPLNMRMCYSAGPPNYYWKSELNNIPADASDPE